LKLSDGSGFARPGYKLVGRNDNEEAADDGFVKFLLGGTYGVSKEPNSLYAVWTRAVTVDFTKKAEVEGSDTPEVKPDVEFTLYSDAACRNVIGTAKSDSNGKVTFTIEAEELAGANRTGTFYLKETSVFDDYIQNTEVYKVTASIPNIDDPSADDFTITINEGTSKYLSGADKQYVILNKLNSLNVTFIKIDGETKEKLGKAKFELSKVNGTDTPEKVGDIEITEELKNTGVTMELGTGNYVLKEVEAPDGYVIMSNVVEFTVNPATGNVVLSDDYDNATVKDNTTIEVSNTAGNPLPNAGGIGTTIFYILGSILVIGCGIVLVSRKRIGSNK